MKYYLNPETKCAHAYAIADLDRVIIPDNFIEISEQEAIAAGKALEQALEDALPKDEKRKLAYPPIEDYLDGVVKGDSAQIEKYIADCLAVKEKYPKN